PRSVPVGLRIPAIGVNARVIPLGLDAGGGVAVPSLSTPFLTSWYDRGSAPGQFGPAVLLGHVDAAGVGPAVFYKLGDLVPGDMVYVTRKDRRTVAFRVTAVALYPQQDFPTRAVYGFTPHPTLRLITCGGDYDQRTHLYLDRTIAFAVYAGRR
ncbi:MAG: class F sortase, partial [Trebonia sp.]